MEYPIKTLEYDALPPLLKEIADPPKKLYLRGALPPEDHKLLTIVGARKYTTYGKQAVETLVDGLRGYPISIISGLALGIDSCAHRSALSAGLHTIAIPGSGLDDRAIYPRTHHRLAREILKSGGTLVSEFTPTFRATPWCFTQRNRIVAGIAHATLVIEAGQRSGTLITARFATEYNRDVLAVPGSILSRNSAGPHMLLRLGAVPICSAGDILEALDIEKASSGTSRAHLSPAEQHVLDLLAEPTDRDALIQALNMSPQAANTLLMEMELHGYIKMYGTQVMKVAV